MNDLASKNLSPHCSLCHQEYDLYYHIPRVVPKCGHTFCQKCIVVRLTVKSNRRVYICNECPTQVVVRKSVGQDIPKNVVIIDMIKNLKKYASNERQDEKKLSTNDNCFQHGKIKELVCETCNYIKICSHCALFGEHKSHIFCKQIPATKINFTELKESFKIVSDSVQNFLMPNGQHNIKKNMLSQIIEGLKKQVTSSFRQFYEIIQKKQVELLQQCDNIIINEGGIDKTIDILIKEFDRLRNKYDCQFKMYTELGLSSQKAGIGLDSIDQFLGKCEQLHKNLQSVQKQAKDHSNKVLKQVGNHILQAGFFKIQQIPFSLKRVIESLNNPNSNEITSPSKHRARLKSTNSEAKPKSVVGSNQSQNTNFINVDRTNKSHKTTNTFKVDKKNRDSFSQIEKRDLQRDDFSILQPAGYSQLDYYKQQPQKQLVNHKPAQQKNIQRGSLPPKANKVKVVSKYDSQAANARSVAKQQLKKHQQKVPRSPAKTVNSVDKSSKSILNLGDSSLTEELKFVCPSKSISAQLISKLQQLLSEVDRQSQLNSSTLELNSADLTDTLLLYVIDYIRTKKYLFQVIKIVKNLLTDEGLKILLSYLVTDNCTQVLNLTSNHLTVRSLQLILLFASKNYILRTIYLSNNKISSLQVKSRKDQLNKYQLQIIV